MESIDKIQGRIAELRDKRDADRQQYMPGRSQTQPN